MTARPRYAKATIGGHPIHVMLVSFPIAFYTAGLVALIVHAATYSVFAYQLAFLSFLAGAGVGLLAAVFGIIDLSSVPTDSPAQKTGAKHMGLNALSVLLFAGAGIMLYTTYEGMPTLSRRPELSYVPALIIALLGFVATCVGGWLGWKLVQTHRVGVDDQPSEIDVPRGSPGSPARRPAQSAGPMPHRL